MPAFIRVFSAINAVREWFTFAGEAVSFLGITKRVAAAGVIAASVAVPVVVASKPAPTLPQLEAARASVQVAGGADMDLGECANGRCSTLYLVQDADRVALARRIVKVCETSTKVSLEQCDAAVRAVGAVEAVARQELRDAARRKAEAEAPPVGKLTMPWEH